MEKRSLFHFLCPIGIPSLPSPAPQPSHPCGFGFANFRSMVSFLAVQRQPLTRQILGPCCTRHQGACPVCRPDMYSPAFFDGSPALSIRVFRPDSSMAKFSTRKPSAQVVHGRGAVRHINFGYFY